MKNFQPKKLLTFVVALACLIACNKTPLKRELPNEPQQTENLVLNLQNINKKYASQRIVMNQKEDTTKAKDKKRVAADIGGAIAGACDGAAFGGIVGAAVVGTIVGFCASYAVGDRLVPITDPGGSWPVNPYDYVGVNHNIALAHCLKYYDEAPPYDSVLTYCRNLVGSFEYSSLFSNSYIATQAVAIDSIVTASSNPMNSVLKYYSDQDKLTYTDSSVVSIYYNGAFNLENVADLKSYTTDYLTEINNSNTIDSYQKSKLFIYLAVASHSYLLNLVN